MADPGWIDAISLEKLPSDDVVAVTVAGVEIAIYRVADEVYATENLCTHGMARLCDGFLDGHEIECPLHQGKFDVRDGRAVCEPAIEPLRTYPIRIEGSRVYVHVE